MSRTMPIGSGGLTDSAREGDVTVSEHNKSPQEIEELTTSIRQMANQVNAHFVLDERKAENYVTASGQRQFTLPNSNK